MKKVTIALLGNPNCGKTTLFNKLTGARRHVGNWPGVTVEKITGSYVHEDQFVQVVDLPGTYSLDVFNENMPADEKITRDFISNGEADFIVNIINATQLERNLYLTSQLLDGGIPVIIVLNMIDVAKSDGIRIDTRLLSEKLKCPVYTLVAKKSRDVLNLKREIDRKIRCEPSPIFSFALSDPIELAVNNIQKYFKEKKESQQVSRWLGISLLEGSTDAKAVTDAEGYGIVKCQRTYLAERFQEDTDFLIADARYKNIGEVVDEVQNKEKHLHVDKKWTNIIDRIVLNRILGIPIFFSVMYLMFLISISFGRGFIGFFEDVAGVLFIDGIFYMLSFFNTPVWINTLAVGLGTGLQTVATFIPVLACLFFCLSVLEDSGYMTRAAFVMDYFLKKIGLPGKALVPLIVGFGCNVPAIMATRTLENERDRMLTMAMIPFMSCGARLPVYAVFSLAFFPTMGHNIVFALYCAGILAALFTGIVVRNFVLKGEEQPFVMEMPNYHIPSLQSTVLYTWDKLKGFVLRAGKVIILVVLLLHVMSSVNIQDSSEQSDSGISLLGLVGKILTPVFKPMGIIEDNWPATVGLVTGIIAKEAVVGTLYSMYNTTFKEKNLVENQPRREFEFWNRLNTVFITLPDRLFKFWESFINLLSFNESVRLKDIVEDQMGSVMGEFSAMKAMFPNTASVIAYLLMVLLYTPCISALGAIYRETNLAWMLFVSGWTFLLGYGVAVFYYQFSVFSEHPMESLFWIFLIISLMGLMVGLMCLLSSKTSETLSDPG